MLVVYTCKQTNTIAIELHVHVGLQYIAYNTTNPGGTMQLFATYPEVRRPTVINSSLQYQESTTGSLLVIPSVVKNNRKLTY